MLKHLKTIIRLVSYLTIPLCGQKRNKSIVINMLFFYSGITLIILTASCSSAISKRDMWEGIQNNILRVYVKMDVPEEINGKDLENTMKARIMEVGRNRAALLLMSYIRAHMTDPDRTENARQKIAAAITRETLRTRVCNEIFCIAVIDYDIKEFMDAAADGTQ
jgi:hypothetical protein